MKNWELGRRDLLKHLGIGAAMLPALRVSKSWAQAGAAPKKLVLFLASEGYIIENWKPKAGPLAGQTLPDGSSPLEPYKSYVNFLHPLTNPSYTGAISGHQAYATIFYGGKNGGGQYPEPTGPTLDQVVAGALPAVPGGRKTLCFQVQVDRTPVSGGRGASRCFYSGPGQAINPELNPFKTYQTLFAGMAAPAMGEMPDPAVQRLFLRRKSVLDYVGGGLTRFQKRVAAEDAKIIEGHLTSIRSLESELTAIAGGKGPRASVANPGMMTDEGILGGPTANKIYPDIMHAYMDMIIAGLSAGVSHVGTLQLSDATGKQVSFGSFVPDIPERGTGYKTPYRNWHDLGHNPSMGGKNHKVIADKWCMAEFAAFIKKMQAIAEPGGTMLDNSLIVWGNHMENGSNHVTQKTPWVTAGKAGGALKTGLCVGDGRSTADAINAFSRAFGAMPAVGTGFPELLA